MASFPFTVPGCNEYIYSWGGSPLGIQLNQLLLFFKIKQFEDLNFIKSYEDYTRNLKKIENIVLSFSNFPIEWEGSDIWDMVPKQIVEAHNSTGDQLYQDALLHFASNIDCMERVQSFFNNTFPKNLISQLENYSINFNDRPTQVSLKYAENFRFKSEHSTFNLFNLAKEKRIGIKPNSDDELIFMMDYRQFEFRTFLNIQGINDYFNGGNLYEKLGNSLKMNAVDIKTSIIAYLYGNKFDTNLEKFFRKNELVDKILNNKVFWFKDQPVYQGNNFESGKMIHTTVQTISQYNYLKKLVPILDLLKNKKSSFIFPLHDAMIFSVHKDEFDLIDEFVNITEDDVYKIKCYVGHNLLEIEEI